ncbi:PREDICTED: translation initiation factor IF-2-like [Capra hircus]|uniref:translation initiation factor IF-2-like n=1 Tax=Capra hircus TaxID=9925 RepID=UPI0008469754|nr:PREDICTED: translation initiation factor IF-2-like [Capra hircus]
MSNWFLSVKWIATGGLITEGETEGHRGNVAFSGSRVTAAARFPSRLRRLFPSPVTQGRIHHPSRPPASPRTEPGFRGEGLGGDTEAASSPAPAPTALGGPASPPPPSALGRPRGRKKGAERRSARRRPAPSRSRLHPQGPRNPRPHPRYSSLDAGPQHCLPSARAPPAPGIRAPEPPPGPGLPTFLSRPLPASGHPGTHTPFPGPPDSASHPLLSGTGDRVLAPPGRLRLGPPRRKSASATLPPVSSVCPRLGLPVAPSLHPARFFCLSPARSPCRSLAPSCHGPAGLCAGPISACISLFSLHLCLCWVSPSLACFLLLAVPSSCCSRSLPLTPAPFLRLSLPLLPR